MVPIFDAHNHLHDARLSTFPCLMEQMREAGVVSSVVNGTHEKDWELVAALAESNPDIVPAFGVHPWFIAENSEGWRQVLVAYLDRLPSTIGEIGLDSWRKPVNTALQDSVFREQMAIAAERNLPTSIHGLRAWGRVLRALQEGPRPACGVLLHSYGGSVELIEPLRRVGAYFSCPGFFLRPGNEGKLDIFRHVPLDRLLIESDAPDQCLPEDLDSYGLRLGSDGQRLNHPGSITVVYEAIAHLRGMSVEDLAHCVEQNYRTLFGRFMRG